MTPDREDVAVAEVLAAHELVWDGRVYPEFECSCGEWDGAQGDDSSETDGQNDNADAFRAHVAEALTPLIAERESRAAVEALREFAKECAEKERDWESEWHRVGDAADYGRFDAWSNASRIADLRADRRAER